MTPEAQRIALAKLEGYTGCVDNKCPYRKAQHLHILDRCFFPENFSVPRYPDYPNELNAVHRVELSLTDDEHDDFRTCLALQMKINPGRNYISATAAKRCEAILRALNLWEETK